jgi:primosomal replication protein N
VGRNRIELVGIVAAAPEVRTTPTGTPVLRIEVNCGEGREVLRLGVVMAGRDAREVGARIAAGATVKVTGTLRAVRGRAWSSAAGGVEVLASEVSDVVAGADS